MFIDLAAYITNIDGNHILQYTGDYIQVFLEKENEYHSNKSLYEIVVHKCIGENSYITLQSMNNMNGKLSYIVNLIWTQVPINSTNDIVNLHRFAIKNEHILLGIDFISNEYSICDTISILKDINDSLIKFNNADVNFILNCYNVNPNAPIYISPTNMMSSMTIPATNFFNLIKYIFYAEDHKYPGSYNLGRYLLQLCILDYLFDNNDYNHTIDKYNNLVLRNK